ncbi:unnamed protein product [Bemisia tabaci]|uniref:Ionotropic receptor n=1 Tax=Bemisia tabaci TaxID=7038 RepID=A0A9P0AAW5_BEMTA|nr:unnamed protein product [Bemisia tabaci]
MIERSKHKLIHVLSIIDEFDTTTLIHNLHDAFIPTLQVEDVQAMRLQFTETEPKTMLIMLDSFSGILNLILGSQNFENSRAPKSVLESSEVSAILKTDKQQSFKLPNYCIHHGVSLKFTLMDPTRACDANLTIPDTQLEGDSVLADDFFNQVRGLYLNNVWNSRNYLIFYVLNTNFSEGNALEADDLIDTMHFAFRFIWRTFKGHKTLICFREVCHHYDPFFERIGIYMEGDPFFDFSWYSMNGKTLTFFIQDFRPFEFDNVLDDDCSFNSFGLLYHALFVLLVVRRGGNLAVSIEYEDWSNRVSDFSAHIVRSGSGLKYGVDLYAIGSGVSNQEDLQHFLVSPTMESCQYNLRVPRQGFMPQEVVPFYCFSPVVWVFIVMTVLIFIPIHYTLAYVHREMFLPSDTDEALQNCELYSATMTIYRYVLGIGQPRLIMVEVITGKIVFFVIVFCMMILITLFQSGMFSLLSSRVRYDDIDTLKEIEDSNLTVQSSNVEIDTQFLGNETEFDWIRQRLTDSFLFKCTHINCHLVSIDTDLVWNDTSADTVEKRQAMKEIDTILKNNAFLMRMATKYTNLKDLIYSDAATGIEYEFHIARERVMNYPLMYFFLRNTFYSDVLNDLLSRVLENGLDLWWSSNHNTRPGFSEYEEIENDEVQRRFSLTDLRLSFITLILGWVMSTICFVLEMLGQF